MKVLERKRIVVTRPLEQSQDLIDQLKHLGALPICIPVIKVVPLELDSLQRKMILSLSEFDWVILSSVNGVRYFFKLLNELQLLPALGEVKVAVVGPVTGQVFEDLFGRKADAMPSEFIAEQLVSCIAENLSGKKILMARSAQARKSIIDLFDNQGAEVVDLPIYDLVSNQDPELLSYVASLEKPDFLTFSSASAVRAFAALMQKLKLDWLQNIPSICIGPITARALNEFGVDAHRVAEEYTSAGILKALIN